MSKQLYRKLCATETSIPIFSRDWWLDAACGDRWDALAFLQNGNVKGLMPIYTPCKGIVSMPNYTQTMGIWFKEDETNEKYSSRIKRRQTVCSAIIEQLGKYRHFMQNFSADFTDWLPFYWAGYSQTTRYTYILEGLKSEQLLPNIRPNIKKNIRLAKEDGISVRTGVAFEEFNRILDLTFKRQGLRNKQSSEVLSRIVDTSRRLGQGEIFGAYDNKGRLHAAAFVVWQESSAYYIAGGRDPELHISGAHGLVIFEAINHAAQYTDKFDFEGSMLPGVERFFREFGAIQTPYFNISSNRMSIMDRALVKISNMIHK